MTTVGLIDREPEMASLESAASQAAAGVPQLVVVWGRRRVGKTFLLSHFSRDRRAVFFGATQQAQGVELSRLTDAVRRDLGEEAADLAGGGFSSWEAALRFFAAVAREQPLVVVLDEVPYLTASTQGFASVVQAVWDHLPAPTQLTLVLCGSAIGMMEAMIGAGGAALKKIGTIARYEIEKMVGHKVFLELFVKVQKDWRENPEFLNAIDWRSMRGEN